MHPNKKHYKILNDKPHLKTPRPLLTFNTCTICNASLNPSTEPTSKHCTPCKDRIHTLKTKLTTLKQNNENNTCNNTIITDNHSDNSIYNSDTTTNI
jgi:hypothetical protein